MQFGYTVGVLGRVEAIDKQSINRLLLPSQNKQQQQQFKTVQQQRVKTCVQVFAQTESGLSKISTPQEVHSSKYINGSNFSSNGVGSLTLSHQEIQSLQPVDHSLVLFYESGWQQPKCHCSVLGGNWETKQLDKVDRGNWWSLSFDIEQHAKNGAVLEFVMTDGQDQWDKKPDGSNYKLHDLGQYSLKHGQVWKLTGKRVMVVSDLDGTMVGEDKGTLQFKKFWQHSASLYGSKLVYNSGRNLKSFEQLLKSKPCLEIPDVYISSVGTKIYEYNPQLQSWQEDLDWSHALDKGWNLEMIREATYAALNKFGTDMMHFRSPEEQNEHKVTCGVHSNIVEQFREFVGEQVESNDNEAEIIVSGEGDWRFVDIVSKYAGKLNALQHIMHKYGYDNSNTIACGDSGNDQSMLSGENLAIVVGNAQPDLRKWAEKEQSQNGHRLIITKEKMANGILEGLNQFGFA